MKKIVFLLGFLFLFNTLSAEKVGIVPGLMKPGMIAVHGDRMYVSEDATFYIYSLDGLKLWKKFGKVGEGPGELNLMPNYPSKLVVRQDEIFVTGFGKAISFTKQGEFRHQMKTRPNVLQLIPAGTNYVAKTIFNAKVTIIKIELLDPELKKIKDLYQQKWPRQGGGASRILDMGLDFTSVVVYDDKIFIEESPEGFLIEVFDTAGNKLYRINREYEEQLLTQRDKAEITQTFRDDPSTKELARQSGGWAGVQKIIKMNFPRAFPPIKGIEVSNEKIFVMTYRVDDKNRMEYLVLDLKGKLLKKVYLPRFLDPPLYALVAGAKLYSISGGKLYYLVENLDEEEWELFVETF